MRRWRVALLGLALVAAGSLIAAPDQPVTEDLAGPTSGPDVDPRADAALRRMSNALAKAKSFTVRSSATVEDRLPSGVVVQRSRNATVWLSRPDGFAAEVRRGSDTYRFWHRGKELTILDVRGNRYTVIQTPEAVEDMLDFLAEKRGIVVPMADLLFPNPYQVLMEKVESGAYVDQQEVDGKTTDHLLFTQDNVDWQIWIDVGEPAVPRRVVITYTQDLDQPQFEAVLSDWQLDPPADAARFQAQVPASASRVEIKAIAATQGDGE